VLAVLVGTLVLAPADLVVATTFEAELGRPPASANWTEDAITVDYGQSVTAELEIRDTNPQGFEWQCRAFRPCTVSVVMDGDGPPVFETVWEPDHGTLAVTLSGADGSMPAGRHEFVATVTSHLVNPASELYAPFSSAPLTLVVEPIALGTTATIAPDSTSRHGVIIGAALRGEYLERVVSPSELGDGRPGIPTPAGTWTVTATVDGETGFEETGQVDEGGPTATSWYWAGAPRGAEVAVSVNFHPSGGAADNIAMEASATSTAATFADAVEAPLDRPEIEGATETASADELVPIPTWAALVAGGSALLLLVLAIILAVRLERRSDRKEAVDA